MPNFRSFFNPLPWLYGHIIDMVDTTFSYWRTLIICYFFQQSLKVQESTCSLHVIWNAHTIFYVLCKWQKSKFHENVLRKTFSTPMHETKFPEIKEFLVKFPELKKFPDTCIPIHFFLLYTLSKKYIPYCTLLILK